MAEEFFEELKRRFYVTPKSFLELIALYLSCSTRSAPMDAAHQAARGGVAKLNETNAVVDGMKAELTELQPVLEARSRRRRRRC